MRKYLIFIFLLSFFIQLQAADFDLLKYDPCSVTTIEGRILSSQEFTFITQPHSNIQLLILTKKGTVIAEIGPKWFLESEGIDLSARLNIEVKGSFQEVNGRLLIIAKTIKMNEREVQLRNEEGQPLWTSWDN